MRLMIRYERQIYRVCYRFVDNREDAMDLAQEVFIKAFEHLGTFRRESSLKTWLYRIAMNHCINHVKKHSQEFVEVTEYTGSVHSSVQHQLEEREQREHFRRLVKHAAAETESDPRNEDQRTTQLRRNRQDFGPLGFDDQGERIFCLGKTAENW